MRISDWSSDVCSSDLGEDRIVVNEIALAFEQHRLMLPAGVEVEPAIVADRDEGGFKLVLELPPLRRDARLRLDRNLAEIGLEHEIDDALGRGIAIFERDLLGENLDLEIGRAHV